MANKQVENIEKTIELSSDELWFLLQQFNPATLLGMQNPHLGWLIEEIEDADHKALKSLVDRNLVRIASRDQIELDDMLATMIRTYAHPQHTLIVQFQNSDGVNNQFYIHFSENLIVEHTEIKSGSHRLTAIKDRKALVNKLGEVLRSSSTTSSSGSKFNLSEQVLFEARSFASQGQTIEALACLRNTGLSAKKATLLTNTLACPIANSAFVTLCNQGKPQLQKC